MLVRLQATSEDNVVHALEFTFEEVDIPVLAKYLENFERMRQAQVFEAGFPMVTNIEWKPESGVSFKVSPFNYAHICELLHLARPLFLSNEPASFENSMAVLGRRFKGTVLTKHLKHIREVYERGDYQPYFQITVNKIPLFADETLKAWLNGVEYHQDTDKAALVASLEKVLGGSVAQGIFVSQLSGRIRAAQMLAHLCALVATPHPK